MDETEPGLIVGEMSSLFSTSVMFHNVDVDVWSYRVGPEPAVDTSHLADLLDARERSNIECRTQPADRDRAWSSAVLRRFILARYLRLSPWEVRFERQCSTCGSAEHGPPRVTNVEGVYFSISHATERVTIAVSSAPIGIDIEQVDGSIEAADLSLLLPHEWRAFVDASRSVGTRDLLKIWTGLEARLKAAGLGLAAVPHDG